MRCTTKTKIIVIFATLRQYNESLKKEGVEETMSHRESHNLFRPAVCLLIIALTLSSAMPAAARSVAYRHALLQGRGKLVTAYMDSLRLFSDSLYRDSVKASRPLYESTTAPLFLPMTFYRGVAHRAFSLDGTLTPTDASLLWVYLHRPGAVKTTQRDLEKTGPVLRPTTITEHPATVVKPTKPEEPEYVPMDMVVFKPNFWNFGGDYYLQFLQSYISPNWYKGGESNYSAVGALTLEAHYDNKQKFRWDNKLEMKLGLQTTKGDSLHKVKSTEDLLRYTGKLGLQATKHWYYTFQLIATTQFLRKYNTNSPNVKSDFMSPFNLNASLGMDYNVSALKNRLTGSIHLAPIAYNLKYVGRQSLAQANGLEEGHHTLHDYGSQFTCDLKWKIWDNFMWQTRLYGYTTYKRSELEWENTFTFSFNRYISAKVYAYPRFDDGVNRDKSFGYWMLNEFVSFGFSYDF